MSADSAKAPGDHVAIVLRAMDLAGLMTFERPKYVTWIAHPEVVAKADELGITVDELVQRCVDEIDR